MKTKIKNRFFTHPLLMLVALILAFIIWLVVTNVSDYKISKTIRDLPVSQENGDAILKSGKVYNVTDGETTSIIVKGPRSVVENLSANDFIATADLSKLSVTNTAEIKVTAVDSKVTGQISIDVVDSMMSLYIENQAEASLPVKVYTTGEVADGYALGTPSTTPNIVTVRGPESVLDTITEVRAVVDVSNLTSQYVMKTSLSCTDAYGVAVDKVNVTLSVTDVTVTIPVYPLKEVPVEVSTIGKPADGYDVRSINYNPETIEVAGDEETLAKIKSIKINNVDISGATETVEQNVQLASFLPEGAYLADSNSVIAISVDIEKQVDRKFTLALNDVSMVNQSTKYDYELSFEKGSEITVTGFADIINRMVAEDLAAHVDVSKLEPGEHRMDLEFKDSDDYKVTSDVKVKITVSEKKDEE